MAASAELLMSALTPLPSQRVHSKRPHEPVALSEPAVPDSGLDGSCSCGCVDAPLTSEPPLADAAPLTSEPPLAEAPLTSEPSGAAFGTELSNI